MKISFRLLRLVTAAVSLFALASCASSTSMLIGSRRPAVPASAVRVYSDAPAHSETIGIVRAHSVIGLGDQGHLNAALDELRAEAGRLGANGVVLTKTEDRPIAFVGDSGKSGFIGVPIATPHLEARAIYVAAH
jgi:hypothetical protein